MSNADNFVRQAFGIREDLGFDAALAYLRQRGGSERGAARLLGVNHSQLVRWRQGRTPKPASRQRVVETVRALRAAPAPADDAFGLKVLRTEPGRKRADREQTIKGGRLKLAPGTMQAARDAYVTGGATAALGTFRQGVGDRFYRSLLTPADDRDTDDDYDLPDNYGAVIL